MQVVASLGVVILAGTGLLLLPNSTYPGITLSFTDALFTSTSAVCVTGLNAVDFAHTFTPLGEMFTLALIQIGGFGIMTFAYFVAMVAGQGFSLRDRVLLTDLLDEDNLGAVVSFITTIVVSTLFIELCGSGPVGTFFRVVLPMLKPTMISVGVLEIMWVWNDYLLPSLVLDINQYRTIPIHIQYLKGSYGTVDMGATMALIMLSILPVIIFYLCCQKHIIKGVAAGAVKG